MNQTQMKVRTKAFGLAVIKLTELLPRSRAAEVIAKQLLRSATSVGANYRSACRAKSPADFVAKLAIVEEEADEAHYWLEVLAESGIVAIGVLEALTKEADELTAIIVSSIKTARSRR